MAGNNNLAVRILINAVDNASGVLGSIQKKWVALGAALSGALFGKGLADAVKKAADFEAALDLIQSKTGANTEEMAKFEAAAVQAGSETSFTATEAANALAILGAAGLSASDSIATLPSVLNLATVEGIGLEQAAGLVTDSVTVMGLSFQESARATDVMVKAANLSSVSAVQMGESLKYAGAVAASAGLSIEQTAAVLDVLASNGLRGEQAGTQLRNILGQLGNPASKARQELAALGITTGDLNTVVDGLAAAGPAATSAIVAFGVESGPALQALMKGGSAAIADYTTKLQGAQGAASEAAGVMGGNLTGAFKGLSSAWDTLSIALTQPLLEPITKAVTELTDKLRAAASDGSLKTFSDALVNGFNEGVTAVKTFISEFNLSELPTRLAAFVTEAKGLLGNLTDSVIVATNTFKTVWNAVYQSVALVGSGLASVFSGIMKGVAWVADGLEMIGIVGDGTADGLRLKAEAMAASAEAMKAESVRAYEEMQASGTRVVDAMGRIIERTSEVGPAAVKAFTTATQSAEQLAAPISEAEQELQRLIAAEEAQAQKTAEVRAAEEAKQAALKGTIDELARLRAEYERLLAVGDTQAAAGLLRQIQSIEERLRGAGDESGAMSAKVVEAFETLGVTSQKELDQLADNAKAAFETIQASGTAAPLDIQNAFVAYATAAIAANNGVADATLKAQAAQVGLAVVATEAGDTIVTKAEAAAQATKNLADSARSAADGVSGIAESADSAADSTEKLGEETEKTRTYTITAEETMRRYGASMLALGDYADVAKEKFIEVQDAMWGMLDSAYSAESYARILNRIYESATKSANAAALLAKEADELDARLSSLNDQYDSGAIGLGDYVANLERLRTQYYRLSEDELADVTDALADAKAEQQDLVDTALSGLNSWKAKLYEIKGQEVELQKLNWAEDKLETELALAEARRNGNAEEIAALQEQLKLINEYYQIKVKEAEVSEAAAKADSAAEQARHEQEISNIEAEAEARQRASDPTTTTTPTGRDTAPVESVRTVNINITTPSGASGSVRVLEGDEDALERLLKSLESGQRVYQ